MSIRTPLDLYNGQGNLSFYKGIIETGKSSPIRGRYIIKHVGKSGVDDDFAVFGAFTDKKNPNSTIRFLGGVDSYTDPDMTGMDVDIIVDETTQESKPLLRKGRPVVAGGRRGRRKTKRARRGRRRSSRRA